jgi:hypothetical protein
MAATPANLPDDFPPETFELRGFCDACGYSATVARADIPAGLSVQGLARRLRCTACGSRETGMRIIYTGAGGFRHGNPALPASHPLKTKCDVTMRSSPASRLSGCCRVY